MKRWPAAAVSCLAMLAAACTSSQDVLNPSAVAASPPSPGQTPPSDAPASVAAIPPAVASRTRLRIDPIVGASVEAAAPLTERLAGQARARGLGIAGSADQTATHVLKGYFSAMTEGRQTTVIYVWDVYDPSGNRLHRINGQQAVASNGAEGWAGVSAQTMQAIADTTVNQLAGWLAAQPG
ncbi:MAG: hypothetical protein ABTQ31_03880 [Rhizobiaceae bacterium]